MATDPTGWNEVGGSSVEEEKEESMPVYWDGVLVGTWHIVKVRVVTTINYEKKTHNASFSHASAVAGTTKSNDSKRNLITEGVTETKSIVTKGAWTTDTAQSRYEQAIAAPEAPSE